MVAGKTSATMASAPSTARAIMLLMRILLGFPPRCDGRARALYLVFLSPRSVFCTCRTHRIAKVRVMQLPGGYFFRRTSEKSDGRGRRGLTALPASKTSEVAANETGQKSDFLDF